MSDKWGDVRHYIAAEIVGHGAEMKEIWRATAVLANIAKKRQPEDMMGWAKTADLSHEMKEMLPDLSGKDLESAAKVIAAIDTFRHGDRKKKSSPN